QLYENEEASAHSSASRALQALRNLSAVDTKLGAILSLVDGATIQIREASRELQHYLETLDVDTARHDEVEKRLAAIEDLARKHRVPAEQIPARQAQLNAELAEVERADADLTTLRQDQAAALESYRVLAQQLSARRATAGRALAKDITTRM